MNMDEPHSSTWIPKKVRTATLIFSLAAFLLCLVVGIQAGSTLRRAPTRAQSSQVSTPAANGQQRTFILALANSLESPQPKLKDIWLVIYQPGTPFVSLVPVYPSAPRLFGKTDFDRHFVLDPNGNLDVSFTEQLQKQGITWNGVILLDDAGLDNLLADRKLDTDQDSLSIQTLCNQVPELLSTPHWAQTFSSLMPQHLHSDLAFETIITDWQALEDPNASLSCEITQP